MTTALRSKISRKIISPIRIFLDGQETNNLINQLPASLRLLRNDNEPPKFEISWKDLVCLQPNLEQRLHPESLFTCLSSQEYFKNKGVTNVEMKASDQPSFVFTVDQQTFTKTVLREFCNNFDSFIDRSCFFRTITPEHVVIDFSSPNIAKPFHFGHFRSTIIGSYIANLFKTVGHKVTSINYIGDWGLQYGLLANGYKTFGSEEDLKENPLLHLFKVYQEANKKSEEDPSFAEDARLYFKRMEEGDPEVIEQWKKFKDLSLENLNQVYKKMGVKFDEIHGESMYVEKATDVLKTLQEKDIVSCESDGSIQLKVANSEYSDEKVFLLKSDGSTLYLTRDIAAAIDRRSKFHFDNMYYVVDSGQQKHFSNLFHIVKEMGCPWHENLHHVSFGRISKFSTRRGDVVLLEDILKQAQERTLQRIIDSPTTKILEGEGMDEVAFNLGISSLIINDLSKKRKKDYDFDWEKILSMNGDSGITLQYCHARLNNIKENCGVRLKPNCDLATLVEPEAIALIHQIARFDEYLCQSYQELEPNILVHYLFKLRHAVGRANKVLTVKGQPLTVGMARLTLFHVSQLVMARGLRILGIEPLNKM